MQQLFIVLCEVYLRGGHCGQVWHHTSLWQHIPLCGAPALTAGWGAAAAA